jgi:hypothetical protein
VSVQASEAASLSATELWERLRPALLHSGFPYPTEVVQAARARREDVAPHLVRVIADLARDPHPAIDDGDYVLHLHAIYLLAEWRDPRAYRPLLQLAAWPQAIVDEVLNSSGEYLGQALASVCDGDVQPLIDLARDPMASIWIRNDALDALRIRALEGDADIEAVRKVLTALAEAEASACAADAERDKRWLSLLVNQLTDAGAADTLPSIRTWFDAQLIDETFIDLEFVESQIGESDAIRLAGLRKFNRGYIRDAVAEFGSWLCFSEKFRNEHAAAAESEGWDEDDAGGIDEDAVLEVPAPYVRAAPKVGRNDPCPCGSGKKYKKCHGAAA